MLVHIVLSEYVLKTTTILHHFHIEDIFICTYPTFFDLSENVYKYFNNLRCVFNISVTNKKSGGHKTSNDRKRFF